MTIILFLIKIILFIFITAIIVYLLDNVCKDNLVEEKIFKVLH